MISRSKLVALGMLALPACNKERPPSSEAAPAAAPVAVKAAEAPATGAAPVSPEAAAPAAPKAATPTVVAAAATGAVIEAGCSYDARALKGNEGDTFKVSCPAGCDKGHSTYGTGVYTADSAICRAGIHAGAIAATGGTVSVRIEPGRPAYRGSLQNGIKSSDYNAYSKSFAVVLSGESAAPAATAAAVASARSAPSDKPAIEAGCSYNALALKGNEGDTFKVSCPAGCEKGRSTYGTGVYTADSAICRAGIHAGAIAATGGTVTVRIEPGRPAYRGSLQNGIKSSDYNAYAKSFAIVAEGAPAK